MLRRRCSCGTPLGMWRCGTAVVIATASQRRQMTSRGQFNPVHAFTSHSTDPEKRATNEQEFEMMITNPGPLRIAYSPDYLDWLYRGYRAKIRYADERRKAETIFKGMLLTEQGGGSGAMGLEQQSTLPGAPPPGHCVRPPNSVRRRAGEAQRSSAQRTLDRVAMQQGMLDLFERQPQFPVIHIDKATRFHLVELFKDMVLDRAWESDEVWDRALLYRAILSERRASYPPSFQYIFSSVEETVLTPRSAPATRDDSMVMTAVPSSERRDSNVITPSETDYLYFVYLVRRYYVDNAVEGHVVLRCHRHPRAAELLFSHPPPKDEKEVLNSIYGSGHAKAEGTAGELASEGSNKANGGKEPAAALSRPRAPVSYPPIEALWRCEENLPLLRILVFGELNLMVSENPFMRFPEAQAFLTRPSSLSTNGSEAAPSGSPSSDDAGQRPQRGHHRRSAGPGDMSSLPFSSIIAEKRGHLFAPLARNVAMSIDGRANDVRRLQQRYEREDTAAFQKLLRGAQVDENPAMYSSYSDWSYFNPRATRAEERDQLSRKALAALKKYDAASQNIYRVGYEEVEQSSMYRPIEDVNSVPAYLPTLPHFIALIKKDPHVAFLTYVGLPEVYGEAHASVPDKKRQLEQLVVQLARMLHRTALDFHKESVRRINRRKVDVAAALLDRFIQSAWTRYSTESATASELAVISDGERGMAKRLGAHAPFQGRIWDDSGFPTDARVEDYARWMAPPAPS